MTFERLMAMLLFEKGAGDNYDPDREREYEEERERIDFICDLQEELLHARFLREVANNKFVMRCNVYIPYYNEVVECRVDERYFAEVYHYSFKDNVQQFDMVGYYGAEYSDYASYGGNLHDHTNDIIPVRKEILGYIISYEIAKRDGKSYQAAEYQKNANRLLKGIGFKDYKGAFYLYDNKGNEYPMYRFISEGVELDEVKSSTLITELENCINAYENHRENSSMIQRLAAARNEANFWKARVAAEERASAENAAREKFEEAKREQAESEDRLAAWLRLAEERREANKRAAEEEERINREYKNERKKVTIQNHPLFKDEIRMP